MSVAFVTYIYALVDPRTDDVRYVGKANDPSARFAWHIKESECGGSSHKCCWIRQVLSEGLTPECEILEEVSDGNWQEAEMEWIYNCREDGYVLTNITDGGDGLSGMAHSEASIRLMSSSQQGNKNAVGPHAMTAEGSGRIGAANARRGMSDYNRQKLIEANLGNTYNAGRISSLETRRKMSAAHSGRVHSLETRKKMSESAKLAWEKRRLEECARA